MDAKWPFMLITFGLLFLLGLTISKLEKNGVMKNWNTRRCEFPVMTAGMFFKPKDDPRSSTKFATDNFIFCMKTYVDEFIELMLAPFQAIFGKHLNLAKDALNVLNIIRKIAEAIYNAFLSFLEPYFRRFTASIYEVGRIVQYLRMSIRRANGIMMSMLFQGLTMFRGMLNTIQFVIKVILIICGIMLAIIIILIFILFPFIPLILSVLGAIVAAILGIIMVVAGSVDKAVSMKNGFCFGKNTKIFIKQLDGTHKAIPISQVKLGDELGFECGKVTAVIKMEGKDVQLYNLNNILVSGSHVVQAENKNISDEEKWNLVEDDSRAVKTEQRSSILYCFNTTTHKIPVYSPVLTYHKNNKSPIIFRDWEEIPDEDLKGQYGWNFIILKALNNSSNYSKWRDSLSKFNDTPILSEETLIKTPHGLVPLKVFNYDNVTHKILNRYGQEQYVLGVIDAIVDDVDKYQKNKGWHTELYEWDKDGKIWVKGKRTVNSGKDQIKGKTLITDSGEFIIWDDESKSEKIVRDFTDIGYNSIHQTYPYVSERLRIIK
jgi:hypothetical protein